ncbi:MAG: hypothetical protein JNJ83_19875 [Verrucomicrobiaceae bacterium]|nr:hypothetical protein [Verrucomicrobiaceae bacterium]
MRSPLKDSVFCALLLVSGVGCKHKEESPKKLRREDIMRQAANDREAVLRYVNAVNRVFEWKRLTEAATPDEVVARFEQISMTGVPDDLAAAWNHLLPVMKNLERGSTVSKEIGLARDRMNEALHRHGILDLKF